MDDQETLPETPAPEAIPMLQCRGEGYITRADGTVIPFTISNEEQ